MDKWVIWIDTPYPPQWKMTSYLTIWTLPSGRLTRYSPVMTPPEASSCCENWAPSSLLTSYAKLYSAVPSSPPIESSWPKSRCPRLLCPPCLSCAPVNWGPRLAATSGPALASFLSALKLDMFDRKANWLDIACIGKYQEWWISGRYLYLTSRYYLVVF